MPRDSSDIVFRLREAAKTMRAHKAASFEASELDHAADEIERLRSEVESWQARDEYSRRISKA